MRPEAPMVRAARVRLEVKGPGGDDPGASQTLDTPGAPSATFDMLHKAAWAAFAACAVAVAAPSSSQVPSKSDQAPAKSDQPTPKTELSPRDQKELGGMLSKALDKITANLAATD